MTTCNIDHSDEKKRCVWVSRDPLYIDYHDNEWGVPCYDAQKLFEKLLLEGAQAGLSWITILKKRPAYRAAFDNFDAQKIARYDEKKVAELLGNAEIVRNKLKINAFIHNAQAYLELQQQQDFSEFIWQFVNGRPQQNRWASMAEIPTQTPASEAMSKALKQRGFKFVGPTICYAYMQSMGLVNDHTTDCFCHAICAA